MKLGDFHSQISEIIKRGSSLDGAIPGAVRRAVKTIERRVTFDYMLDYYRETLKENESSIQNWTSVDKRNIKSIKSAKLLSADESAVFWLKKDDERQYPSRPIGPPSSYWLSKVKEVHFDTFANADQLIEFRLAVYTAWPTELSVEPAILDNHEDLVLYRSMLEMAPYMRQAGELLTTYKALYDDAIGSAVESQVDLEEDNSDHNMQYGELW